MPKIRKRIQIQVILLFACVIHLFSGCSAMKIYPDDHWFGRDKLYHFTCSGIIAAAGSYAAYQGHGGENDALLTGASLTFTAGAGKEVYDVRIKRTYWSWKDCVWDLIGGAVGTYTVIATQ